MASFYLAAPSRSNHVAAVCLYHQGVLTRFKAMWSGALLFTFCTGLRVGDARASSQIRRDFLFVYSRMDGFRLPLNLE